MLTATHIMAGCLVGINYARLSGYPEPLAVIIFSAYGSVLPNVDHSTEMFVRNRLPDGPLKQHLQHRELFHSPLGCGIAWLICRILFHQIAAPINGFFLSAMVHIFMDLFTYDGIPLFYPNRYRISFANQDRGSLVEMMILMPVMFWRIIMDIQKIPPNILYNWDGHLFP